MATLRDVAALAGVSTAVVSAVVSPGRNNIRVGAATRARVLQAVEECGYRRNEAARALATSRPGIISVLVPRVSSPVVMSAIDGMQALAQDEGIALVLTDADWVEAEGKLSSLMTRLSGTGIVDGFLVRTTSVGSEAVSDLEAHNVPFLMLHEPFPGYDHTCVWVDDEPGIKLATGHLLDLGHRRVAMVGGPVTTGGTNARVNGFHHAFSELGLTAPDSIRAVGYRDEDVAGAVQALFSSGQPPTALIVDNTVAVPAALAALTDLGVKVPDDVSLVAYHDSPLMKTLRPTITSVKMPVEAAGRLGLQTLLRLIAKEPVSSILVRDPAPALLMRGSTAVP